MVKKYFAVLNRVGVAHELRDRRTESRAKLPVIADTVSRRFDVILSDSV